MVRPEDITVQDADHFAAFLNGDQPTSEEVYTVALSLGSDIGADSAARLRQRYAESGDLLTFLCHAPEVLVNAIINNALYTCVSPGKGVYLRDMFCSLTSGKGPEAVAGWADLPPADKQKRLAEWTATVTF
jgi:hypothetical protein